MKIVIIGASGNVGTALLRALGEAEDVTEVVGLARRVPSRTPAPPYDLARWARVDVGGPDEPAIIETLADAMRGADAVIQLAWVIQPNHHRDTLRRVNVLGTARVLEAARLARIRHLVVASSVAAYSPAEDNELHDEAWPIGGVRSSEYSVDKARVERMLDAHEHSNPRMLITRLRPALIFQRDVGSQVLRNFMAPLIPRAAFSGRLPVTPFPAGVKVQAVHADDIAQAYLAAARLWPGGAINVAADDVLGEDELADLLARGRALPVAPWLMRTGAWAAWQARALAASPGWLDLADKAPLMATNKAREVLEWSPRRSAHDTLAELFQGMAAGAGTTSPPLKAAASG